LTSSSGPGEVTALLVAWHKGDQAALDRLVPIVHDELHRLAERVMKGERPGHSLQATALVNEAYLRLVDVRRIDWQDRAHFLAMSARVMRRILVDHARARNYQKRGGNAVRVTFAEGLDVADQSAADLVALDDALQALTARDERKARVVELRIFGGLSVEESAVVLKVAPGTITRDWNFAKSWLRRELRRGPADDGAR
jgi:RNA polymerase sigma factor (TIGR02999 family)